MGFLEPMIDHMGPLVLQDEGYCEGEWSGVERYEDGMGWDGIFLLSGGCGVVSA